MGPRYLPLRGHPTQTTDVSRRSLRIARVIDRLCQDPGQYAIIITVPTHRRSPWLVQFIQLDPMQEMKMGR